MHKSRGTAAVLILAMAAGTITSASLSCREKHLKLKIQRVKVNGNVTAHCSNELSAEMSFSLWYNEYKVITSSYNENQTKTHNSTQQEMELHVDHNKKTAYFQLSQVDLNRTGLYTCEAAILYPPPYKRLPEEQTMVIVEDEMCQKQEVSQCPITLLTPAWYTIGCSLLGVYCCVMTCIIIVLWHKLKIKQCLQNDYMNMKPRGFRKHPRVQHPPIMGKY